MNIAVKKGGKLGESWNYQSTMHKECVVLDSGNAFGEPFVFVFDSRWNHHLLSWNPLSLSLSSTDAAGWFSYVRY